MLALSLRMNSSEAGKVLEELNAGHREQTYPHTLKRCFRTIEHDARAAGLPKLVAFAEAAKEVAARVLDPKEMGPLTELLAEAIGELQRAADAIESAQPHKLDEALLERLVEAKPKKPASLDEFE